MDWLLLAICTLCGFGSLFALLRASLKLEGLQATALTALAASLAVASTFLFVYLVKGLITVT